MKHIYSLEDDEDIAKIIRVSLTKVGYDVRSFATGKSFLEAFYKEKPDMALLDLMLPDGSGMDILKKLRKDPTNDNVKMIIISAKRMTMDKVEGLDSGADDYIEKPFDILELISRVNARFRNDRKELSYKGITLDEDNHSVKEEGKNVNLTNSEFSILKLLLQKQGSVVKREDIYKLLYPESEEVETRTIDMHIASLRKKLNDKENHLIRTVYGIGYIMD